MPKIRFLAHITFQDPNNDHKILNWVSCFIKYYITLRDMADPDLGHRTHKTAI